MYESTYILTVAAASALVGLLSGIMGTYTVLRKESLIGDCVSHSALPGIAIAFMIMGVKNQVGLILGAIIAGVLAVGIVVAISKNSKISFDSSLALALSSFFGFGMVLLGLIQRSGNANQSGLDSYIFGQAATVIKSDLYPILGVMIITVVVVALFYKEFKLYSFDPEYAKTIGFSTKFIGLLMNLLVVMAVVVGLQSVGVILMSAMLIGPASAARQWSNKLFGNILLSCVIGFSCGVLGTLMSVQYKLPTGPSIVMILMSVVLFSLLFAPNRGIIAKTREKKKRREHNDRLLVLYMADHLMHTSRDRDEQSLISSLNAKKISKSDIEKYIRDAVDMGLLLKSGNELTLSESGHEKLREEGLLWTHMDKSN